MYICASIDIPTEKPHTLETLLVYEEQIDGLGMGYSYGQDSVTTYLFYHVEVSLLIGKKPVKPKIRKVGSSFAMEVYKKLDCRKDRINLWMILRNCNVIKTKKGKYYEGGDVG